MPIDADAPRIVRWTSRALPKSPDVARAIDAPLGVVVRPLLGTEDADADANADADEGFVRVKSAEHIARCHACFGYISSACVIDARGFVCATCEARTSWDACAARGGRYRDVPFAELQRLPEVQSATYSFDIAREVISTPALAPGVHEAGIDDAAPDDWRRRVDAERRRRSSPRRSDGRAVVIIVDLNDASEEYCELMRTTIMGCVEALAGEDVRFGVFAFRGDALEVLHVDDEARGGGDADANNSVIRLRYFDTHANAKKHGFIRRVRDAVPTSLEDVLPSALTRRAAIEDAVENGLRSGSSGSSGSSGGGTCSGGTQGSGGDFSSGDTKRIFGPVLDEALGVIEDAFDEGLMSSARVLTFLRGAPDAGLGACDVASRGGIDGSGVQRVQNLDVAPPTTLDFELASSEAEALMIPAHDYYELVGERCALSGVEVDVVVISDTFCDMSTLAPLAERSGGRVMMYEDRADVPVVGDVFRLLTRSRGVNCTLRVRCSPGLDISRAYGALVADTAYPGLYHIASCTPDDAFAFDCSFDAAQAANTNGDFRSASSSKSSPPTIQVAFEYTTTTRSADGIVTRRRCRRVHTSRAAVAKSAREAYKTLDVNVVAALIAHHALANADEYGLVEARARALDWLVAFVSKAHVFARGGGDGDDAGAQNDVDVDFSLLPHLAPTTRLVYGLLRSKMLFPFAIPDARCVARSRALRCSADDVADYAYPTLTEFAFAGDGTTTTTTKTTPIRLRRDALRDDCVYILDAPQDIIVYYGSSAARDGDDDVFDGIIEDAVRMARMRRTFQPRVWRIRGGGVDDPTPLERYLVEDLDVEYSGRGRGFDGFVEDYLKARCREEIRMRHESVLGVSAAS